MKKLNLLLITFLISKLITYGQELPSTFPKEGLICFYPFENNSIDYSENHLDGIIYGCQSKIYPAEISNSVYIFDGSDYIDLGNSNILNPSNQISFSSDFLIYSDFQNNFIFGRNTETATDYGYNFGIIELEGQTYLRFGVGDNSEGFNLIDINVPVQLEYNTWYNYTGTFNGTKLKFYLDGELLDTANVVLPNGLHINTYNTFIGKYRASGGTCNCQFFKGELDNVGMWNRELTIEEINLLMELQYNSIQDLNLSNDTIYENLPIGTEVGILSTSDLDKENTYTYSLISGIGDSDNGSFSISGDTLFTNEEFDFETKSSYSVRIQTKDSGGEVFSKQFIINVSNEIEVGIESLNKIDVILYPNPAKDFVNIKSPNLEQVVCSFYTIGGCLIKEILISPQQKINVEDLNPGVYLVKINSNQCSQQSKIIITK